MDIRIGRMGKFCQMKRETGMKGKGLKWMSEADNSVEKDSLFFI